MILQNNRKAFSMITAIVVIVLMSSVAILITDISGKMVKETTTQYQKEQAILLAKSYTNYAILAISGNDRKSSCLKTLFGTTSDSIYSAQIEISYIGENSEVSNCGVRDLGHTNLDNNNSSNPLTAIIDAYIKYDDLDDPNNRQFTYHRRTVQKI